MLSEMRFGYAYGVDNAIPELSTEQVWRMATVDAAVVVGLQDYVGSLEVGLVARPAVTLLMSL